MRQIKRRMSAILSLVLALSLLTGCGGTGTQAPAQNNSPAAGRENVATDGNGWYLWDEDGAINLTGRGAESEHAMVASAKVEASQAGLSILKAGGNAIDAAIATAFALSVVEPNASGIGGGGHMLVYTADGDAHFIDFRGTAPASATLQTWNRKAYGGQAACIPAEVAGLWYVYEHFGSGKIEWADLLAPAIELAEEGFYVSPTLYKDILNTYDFSTTYEAFGDFITNDGLPYEVGDLYINTDQAKALHLIAEQGPDGFYKGEVAEAIVDSLQADGGFMTLEDLEDVQVRELDVVRGSYRGYELVSTPFGGSTTIEALQIMENYDISSMEFGSSELVNLYAEAFCASFRDRFDHLGDPEYQDIPFENLLSKSLAAERASQIKLGQITDFEKIKNITDYEDSHESLDTTHISVADEDGNMVACTQTINGIFGCKIVVEGYGFMLNNVMDAFSTSASRPNALAPGKTPNSSMSPMVVLKDGKPYLVIGTPGARHIITTMTEVLVDIIDYGMGVQEAVDAPRMFYDTEGILQHESRYSEDTITKLTDIGYELQEYDEFDKTFGSVQAIQYADGGLIGAADPRRDGKALGY